MVFLFDGRGEPAGKSGYTGRVVRTLRARLFASLMGATFVVGLVAWLAADPMLVSGAKEEVKRELDAVVERLEAALADRGSEALTSDVLQRNGAAVLDEQGRVVASTLAAAKGASARVLARLDATPSLEILDRSVSPPTLTRYVRSASGAILVASRPLFGLEAARSALQQVLFLGGVLAFLMASLLAQYLTRSIGHPIEQMTQMAEALRRGDYSNRVRSRRRDELGALGAAVDQMADQLVERFNAIRRERERLRTMLDAMVEGVLVTDADGRIALTNPALTEIAGAKVEQRTVVEAIRSADLHEAVRRALGGRASEVQFEVANLAGRRRILVAQVTPLPNRAGVVAVLRDLTELRRVDLVRRDFVANASHELRTPLTAIRGFAETLIDGALEDPRMARRFVLSISDNARRLQSLVDDLLELSRAEAPEAGLELVPVDVAEVAARVLSGLLAKANEKRQQLMLEGAGSPVFAKADSQALDQVLLNLVDNAIKYTPAEGRVTLRIGGGGEESVWVDVEDNGPGIPRPHLGRIFERFYRVDKGRARAQGGTGLGLSIVRHLMGRLGGEVVVSSRVGEGTTFRIWLQPARAAGADREAERTAPGHDIDPSL